jgi:hypothetical protein
MNGMLDWRLLGLRFVTVASLSLVLIIPPAILFPKMVGPPGRPVDLTLCLGLVVLASPFVVQIVVSVVPFCWREILLEILKSSAACSIVSFLLCSTDIRFPVVEVPTPHLLSRLLRLDGEFSYDADVFEIWLGIFALMLFTSFGLRRLFQSRAS